MRTHPCLRTLAIVVAALGLATACGDSGPSEPAEPAAPAAQLSFPPPMSPYEPTIDPADFVAGIDNPYMPFTPGTTFVFEGESEGQKEKDTVYVTDKTREILGVNCTVVEDVVTVEGEIAEKTFDWYAQDRYGNVWYFGEDSKSYEGGKPKSSKGSWEAGVDGAQPGIIMLGEFHVGDRYRQEYYAGEAEDLARVLKLDDSIEVPYGSFDNVLVTREWSPLEPDVVEHKYYASGVGVIFEQSVKGEHEELRLIEITHD